MVGEHKPTPRDNQRKERVATIALCFIRGRTRVQREEDRSPCTNHAHAESHRGLPRNTRVRYASFTRVKETAGSASRTLTTYLILICFAEKCFFGIGAIDKQQIDSNHHTEIVLPCFCSWQSGWLTSLLEASYSMMSFLVPAAFKRRTNSFTAGWPRFTCARKTMFFSAGVTWLALAKVMLISGRWKRMIMYSY